MWLSKVNIRRSRAALAWLADPYHVHQRLYMSVGDDARPLYRVEGSTILVQTQARPDWSLSFADVPFVEGFPKTREAPSEWPEGAYLAFRLRANPTQRVRLADGSKKRVGVCGDDSQRRWLRRKAIEGGFGLGAVRVEWQAPMTLRKPGHLCKLESVLYEGFLVVDDPELFAATLASGIGSGKGYGFGLLSVRPVEEVLDAVTV